MIFGVRIAPDVGRVDAHRAADWFIGRILEAARLLVANEAALEARLDPRDNDDSRDVDRWRDVDSVLKGAQWRPVESEENDEWRLAMDGERLEIEWGPDLEQERSNDVDRELGMDLTPVDNLDKAAKLVFWAEYFVAVATLLFALGLLCAERDLAVGNLVLFIPIVALDAPFTLASTVDLEDRVGLSPVLFFLVGTSIFPLPPFNAC